MRAVSRLLPALFAAPVFAAAATVEHLYKSYCAGCHGEDLRGGSGSSLVDGVWKMGDSDEAVAKVIRDGDGVNGGMPPMDKAVSEAQLRALVVFIREREGQAAKSKTPATKPDLKIVRRTRFASFRTEVVADDLKKPWGVAPLTDGRVLITEKAGRIFIVGADGKKSSAVKDTPPVLEHGQGGLMDIAAHPDFEHNGLIYLSFCEGAPAGKPARCDTAIVRGVIRDGRWTGTERIWSSKPEFHIGSGVHFGSRIAFDGAGHVFFSVGERGRNMDRGAQDLCTPHGKILRLTDDGRVPADNPFVKTPGAEPAIWSYGHRNPQGLATDPRDGSLYETEHGPRGGDELNLIRPGLNYGWPVVTFGMNYDGTPWGAGETSRRGMEPPATYWTPSPALCGMAFVRGDKFPAWRGDCLIGALAGGEVRRLRIVDRRIVEQEILLSGMGRVRDVKCGPDGSVYILLNAPDLLLRLVPAE